MKHKMNKISGYYEGPDGVFYNFKHDTIFQLEHTPIEIVRIINKRAVTVGKQYIHRPQISSSNKPVAITGLRYCIRLGDL